MSKERPPLVEAIFNRDEKAARQAIEAGADLNEVYAGISLVSLAAYNGSKEVLHILIESGSKVAKNNLSIRGEMDMIDWKISTPDCVIEYAEVTRLLIEAGASKEVRAYDGSSLIDYYAGGYYKPIRDVLSKQS